MFADHCIDRPLTEDDVEAVASDVVQRTKDYGYQPKGPALLEAAYESAALLGFDVDEGTARKIAVKARGLLT